MNGLASSLGWLTLQITAMGLAAWLLDALLARRCPGAAARLLAVAFAGAAFLTAIAFGPLPGWWTWQGARAPVAVPSHPMEPHADATAQLSAPAVERSEEHTSELQSLRHLVCRLLLEKKKKKTKKYARNMSAGGIELAPAGTRITD